MGLREMAESQPDGHLPAGPNPQWAAPTPEENGRAVAAALAESPVPAEMDVPVHIAWSRVMGDVQWIAKADSGKDIKYNYRGVDRVVDTVAPVLRRHGVIVMPTKTRAEYTVINTRSGAAMNYCRATVSYVIIGPKGDALQIPHPDTGQMVTLLGESLGEGFDTGDKSSMKAQSVAYREFLIKALAIPVNRPAADPEHGEQHEIAGPPRPTAEQYVAMILDEGVSVNRLSQIKAELYGDRAMGATVVEMADGEKIRLVDLVLREGRRKKAADGGGA